MVAFASVNERSAMAVSLWWISCNSDGANGEIANESNRKLPSSGSESS